MFNFINKLFTLPNKAAELIEANGVKCGTCKHVRFVIPTKVTKVKPHHALFHGIVPDSGPFCFKTFYYHVGKWTGTKHRGIHSCAVTRSDCTEELWPETQCGPAGKWYEYEWGTITDKGD